MVSEKFESLEKEWEMVLETQIRATLWRTEDNKEVRSSRKPMNQCRTPPFVPGLREGSHPPTIQTSWSSTSAPRQASNTFRQWTSGGFTQLALLGPSPHP